MLRRVIIAFLIVVCSVALPAHAADSIAKVVAIVGGPTAVGPGGSRKLAVGDDVFEKDKISVTSGNAQILFNDGTKLVVGPGSSLEINKYLMRGDSSAAQDFSIKALRGTFRFITGKSPKNAYNIQTANATIGIRGTGFDFWVKDATGVAVLQGKVRLCGKQNSKSCVDLTPTCELGTTENASARKFTGELQGQKLRKNLPFILNQKSLVKSFRLDVTGCRTALSYTPPEFGNGKGNNFDNPRASRPQTPLGKN